MSLGKRILDLARANLNALLEKAGGEATVDELTDEELEAELRRRRDLRQREEVERQSREAAERAARERYTQRTGREPPPPRASQRKKAPPPRVPINRTEKRLRELYAQLEVPYGAGFDEVKKSFRRLMRKYHPDLHAGNPEMQKVATQLTMSLTQAYNELEEHLVGGRRS